MKRELTTSPSVKSIACALEVDIVLGRLYPRERLVEESLTRRFGTKRHVVRQALLELEIAGLVRRETNKGVNVCEYSADEVNQLYQMREFLERKAAMMVPLPISPENHAQLKSICDIHGSAIKDSDMITVVAANKEFHQVLYRLCGNDFLADVIDEMAKKSNLVRFTSSTDFTLLRKARDQHYQMLDALSIDNNHSLASLCVEHIQPSRQMYLERKGSI